VRDRLLATTLCLALLSVGFVTHAQTTVDATPDASSLSDSRLIAYASGERPLRVLLARSADRVRVMCDGPVSVRNDASGSTVLSSEDRDVVLSFTGDASAPVRGEVGASDARQYVSLKARRYAVSPRGDAPLRIRVADKRGDVLLESTYPGAVRAEPNGDGGLRLLNLVPVDTYLLGVLGPEMGSGAPLEALKAQAVAARSYAVWQALSRADEPYDLRTDTSDQVYRGTGSLSTPVSDAVQATHGLLLLADNHVCRATYHACCGGATCTGSDVWRGESPGLTAVFDGKGALGALSNEADARRFLLEPPSGVFCKDHALFRWRERFSAEQLAANLRAAAGRVSVRGTSRIGRLRDITVDERSASGRVVSITFVGSDGSATVRGDDIRLALGGAAVGGASVRSTFLAIDKAGPAPPYSAYEIYGGGWGHGTGLCQAGAMGMADAGYTYREILKPYYGDCELAGLERADGA